MRGSKSSNRRITDGGADIVDRQALARIDRLQGRHEDVVEDVTDTSSSGSKPDNEIGGPAIERESKATNNSVVEISREPSIE